MIEIDFNKMVASLFHEHISPDDNLTRDYRDKEIRDFTDALWAEIMKAVEPQ
tara:strand:+ start:335 stop:490 length:156 start_codon:yes stop_codon:yes gene_type:complete